MLKEGLRGGGLSRSPLSFPPNQMRASLIPTLAHGPHNFRRFCASHHQPSDLPISILKVNTHPAHCRTKFSIFSRTSIYRPPSQLAAWIQFLLHLQSRGIYYCGRAPICILFYNHNTINCLISSIDLINKRGSCPFLLSTIPLHSPTVQSYYL